MLVAAVVATVGLALALWQPSLLLINTAHVRRSIDRPAERALLEALKSGALGLARLGTHREPVPPWALAWHWPYFHQERAQGLVNLDKINPEIEVWMRRSKPGRERDGES